MVRLKDWNLILQESHDNFTSLIDEVSSSVTYLGKAQIGSATSDSSWQIQKISVSGTVTTIAWADGTDAFTNVWDDRASYTYS